MVDEVGEVDLRVVSVALAVVGIGVLSSQVVAFRGVSREAEEREENHHRWNFCVPASLRRARLTDNRDQVDPW